MNLEQWLDVTVGGIPLSQILIALATAVVFTVLLRWLTGLALGRIRKLAGRTTNDIDDLVVELLDKTRTLLIGLVVLWAAARPLDLPADAERVLVVILVLGFHLQVGLWGSGIIDYLIGRWKRQQIEDDPGVATALGAASFITRMLLWTVLALTALGTLGVQVNAFVTSLGIGGVAVALALQNVLGDLFGSLSIVIDKPFVLGDFVQVGDMSGTVENVGLKTTRIRSLSGEQLVFANSDLLTSRIRNYGRMRERRIVFPVGVIYGTPPDALRKIPAMIRAAVESQANARFDRSHLKAFGNSSLDFETVYYMEVPDYASYMDTQQEINLAIFKSFTEAGIEFAFPTRTLHVVEVPPGLPPAPASNGG